MLVQCATTAFPLQRIATQAQTSLTGRTTVSHFSNYENNTCTFFTVLLPLYLHLYRIPMHPLVTYLNLWRLVIIDFLKCNEASFKQQVNNSIWVPVGSQNHYQLCVYHSVSNAAFMYIRTYSYNQEKANGTYHGKIVPSSTQMDLLLDKRNLLYVSGFYLGIEFVVVVR